jgi:hypothetical protein
LSSVEVPSFVSFLPHSISISTGAGGVSILALVSDMVAVEMKCHAEKNEGNKKHKKNKHNKYKGKVYTTEMIG